MKYPIIFIFVSLAAYGSTSSTQQPTIWTSPYFYYHYNTPLSLPGQKISANEMLGDQKHFSGNDDHSIQSTLGSHVVLLTTCLRDLRTTKADLVHTHSEIETVKKELKELKENSQFTSTSTQLMANVMATVENMKKEMTGMVHKSDLAQTTQRLDETQTSVEIVKKELIAMQADVTQKHTVVENLKTEMTHLITTYENLKKEMNASTATSIGRMPKSCDDLQKIGHRKSGFFMVVGDKTVDNVYCDFTKPVNDAGFQRLMGYFDVKTSPVYFHAQRSESYHKNLNSPIPFDLFRLNLGNAMNTSGIFVAPKTGKYLFAYSGLSEVKSVARVELQVKTDTKDWSRVGQAWGGLEVQTFSLQSILELDKGNQIRLMLLEGAIRDHASHYTNFSGQLLEEDII